MNGNKEIRFRASEQIHHTASQVQQELGLSDKSTAIKLLLSLGENRLNAIVENLYSLSTGLSDRQFCDMFSVLKVRCVQLRKDRKGSELF